MSSFWRTCRRVASGGAGGHCPPIFVFVPPDLFLSPPRYFFGRKKLLFLAGKNVKICDFGQKKPSDFGEDLFFWRFSLKLRLNPIQEQGNIWVKFNTGFQLCPPDFNFAPPPRSREAGEAPEDMSSLLMKNNLSSEDVKKCLNVLLFGILNRQNMSIHAAF